MSVSDPSPESFSEQSNGNEDIEEGLNTEFSTPLQLEQPETSTNISPKAALAFSILCDLLDECTLDVIFEAHREAKLSGSICQICNTECRSFVVQPGLDIFGNHPQQNNSPTFECVNCQRPYPSKRYAPHLEKCMGLAGRNSSRVANLRLSSERNSSSPYTPVYSEDNINQSDSDDDLYVEKKPPSLFSHVIYTQCLLFQARDPTENQERHRQLNFPISDTVEAPNFVSTVVTKLKLIPGKASRSQSPAPSSNSDSPYRSQSPLKHSYSMSHINGTGLTDELKQTHLFEQTKSNGVNASEHGDTSTQSSTVDNDYIDIDGDDEVLQTSNDSSFLA
ncbi:446_t:CDS:10 [Dentiscutata erythropus]|uniref:SAGA-associated factor 11 n=1 Tax=Dentiscutata erythropus TaxID=1348616 RepID=A0A9N9BAF0_9GLOM|nr:446_t:CDS:10 [Dentiscutata erythropus]